MPFVAEALGVSVNWNNKKSLTSTFYLTFKGTSLPQKVRLGFERFDVDLYIPFPRRCFKCQKYGHNSSTCQATADVCPLCLGTGHKQDSCPNKESLKCPNCNGPHSATGRECPAYISEKRALHIQAETHCTLQPENKLDKLLQMFLQPESKLNKLQQLNQQQVHLPKS